MKTTLKYITPLLLGFIIIFSGCEKGISGTGDSILYTTELSEYDAIDISLAADISIEYAGENEMSFWAQENIKENMEIFVSKRTLYIKFDEHVRRHTPISINILTPKLESINLNGACDVEVVSAFTSDNFDMHLRGLNQVRFRDSIYCNNMSLNVSGTSHLDAQYINVNENAKIHISGFSESKIKELYCEEFNYKVSGTAAPHIKGYCQHQSIKSSGTLNYTGIDFQSQSCSIDVSGTAELEVYVEDELSVDVSGTAKVKYKGQPAIHKQSNQNVSLVTYD